MHFPSSKSFTLTMFFELFIVSYAVIPPIDCSILERVPNTVNCFCRFEDGFIDFLFRFFMEE